nr:probable beta-1,3-galactosyltransferase 14 [Ipomoea batatas]
MLSSVVCRPSRGKIDAWSRNDNITHIVLIYAIFFYGLTVVALPTLTVYNVCRTNGIKSKMAALRREIAEYYDDFVLLDIEEELYLAFFKAAYALYDFRILRPKLMD